MHQETYEEYRENAISFILSRPFAGYFGFPIDTQDMEKRRARHFKNLLYEGYTSLKLQTSLFEETDEEHEQSHYTYYGRPWPGNSFKNFGLFLEVYLPFKNEFVAYIRWYTTDKGRRNGIRDILQQVLKNHPEHELKPDEVWPYDIRTIEFSRNFAWTEKYNTWLARVLNAI